MRIALITAPYSLGHEGISVGAGPGEIIAAGAVESLEQAGHQVEVVKVEPRSRETNEVGASFEIVRRVAEAVAQAVESNSFPLVLAGNCMSSIGIVAGLGRNVGVVWLDAHPDFNTPDGSLSGFADGMGLSILTGTSWKALRGTVPGYRAVPEADVVLIGIRDINPPEQERLDASEVQVLLPDEAGGGIGEVVDRLRERVEDVYLHVDLDVLDPSEGRANEYAADGGLSATALEQVVDAVTERGSVRAAALTAYDPSADPDRRIPALAVRLATRIADRALAPAEAPTR
jgi:arginase